MRWPWQRVEKRETASGSYTDTLIQGLLAQAQGTIKSDPGATAALEAAAGLWSRALASATVEGDRYGAVTPEVLSIIGRAWIRHGESVFLIEAGDRVRLVPASTWDLTGGYHPEAWVYRADVEGPSGKQDCPGRRGRRGSYAFCRGRGPAMERAASDGLRHRDRGAAREP